MPVPPGDIGYYDKVNYVIDAWARPCEAPWYIYVETLWPALLEAFITLATFGWDDVARGYFRPRGLGARRTGKRKGKWRRAVPRFPEIGEEIGHRLPGAEQVKGERWSVPGKTLWRIDTVLQRLAFYWLVADVTIDLAYNFTSVLYETVWCQASDLGRFSYSQPGVDVRSGGNWWNVSFPDEDYEHAPPTWGLIKGFSGPTGCTASAGVGFNTFPGHAPPTNTGVRLEEFGGNRIFAQTGPSPTNPDGSARMPVSGNIPPNTTWRVTAWHDTTLAEVGNAVTVGMQT